MTTLTTTEALTTQNLRALRNATAVVFTARADGTAEIRAIRDADRSSSGFEDSVSIPVGNASQRTLTGFAHMSSYHEGWRTMVQHVLRAGDQVALSFRADYGTNNYARSARGDSTLLPEGERDGGIYYAGLHVDEFWLVITRGNKRLDFMMDIGVCPDNTARMCKKS